MLISDVGVVPASLPQRADWWTRNGADESRAMQITRGGPSLFYAQPITLQVTVRRFSA